MKRLATLICSLAVLALFATGCHGSWQSAGGVYWFNSSECVDGFAKALIFNPPYQGSKAGHSTGYFSADASGCHPFGRNAGAVQIATELVKVDYGICQPGPGWAQNSQGSYAAIQEWTIPYFCGGGNYFVGAHNWALTFCCGAATKYTTIADNWSG